MPADRDNILLRDACSAAAREYSTRKYIASEYTALRVVTVR